MWQRRLWCSKHGIVYPTPIRARVPAEVFIITIITILVVNVLRQILVKQLERKVKKVTLIKGQGIYWEFLQTRAGLYSSVMDEQRQW